MTKMEIIERPDSDEVRQTKILAFSFLTAILVIAICLFLSSQSTFTGQLTYNGVSMNGTISVPSYVLKMLV